MSDDTKQINEDDAPQESTKRNEEGMIHQEPEMVHGDVKMEETEDGIPEGMVVSGTKHGLLIIWDDNLTFGKAKTLLVREFKKSPVFFRESVAQIGFEGRALTAKQEKSLRAACEQFEVLYRPLPRNFKEKQKEANAFMMAKTLRSGQTLEFNGNIVVLGDVHPGAEVIAAGHVIVWGSLRGTVHAGAAGNDKAIVCAMRLMPMQLRIGDFVAVDHSVKEPPTDPEIAFIRDKEIVAEAWDRKSFFKMGVALAG